MQSKLFFLIAFIPLNLLFSQTKMNKIQELLAVSDLTQLVRRQVDSKVEGLQLIKEFPKEVKDSMRVIMLTAKPALADSLAVFYEKHYTIEEIDAMLAFYKSPIGLKMKQLEVKLKTEMKSAFDKWRAEHNEVFMAMINRFEQKQVSQNPNFNADEIFNQATPYVQTRSKNLDGEFKSAKLPYRLQYDSNLWEEVDCAGFNDNAEACFLTKNKQIYSMIIAESIQMDIRKLKALALSNMQKLAKKVDVREVGLIKLNEIELLKMEIDVNINSIEASYYNYYHSADWGVLQLMTFCATEQLDNNLPLMTALNNGLILEK